MREFFAKLSVTALFVLAIFSAYGAEKVTFEATSPLTVAAGEAFRVEFALNASPDDNSFKAPSFEGFDVLAGPAESKGTSVQIVNGSMTRSINYTITYVLVAHEAGNVTIGAASVAVDGTTYRTSPLPVEIVDEASAGGGSAQQGGGLDASKDRAQGQVAQDDLLLRAVVSRTSVYKGEPLLLTFKLSYRVPIVGTREAKLPSFNGFWAQELDNNSQQVRRETINGKVYESQVWTEYVLYPQQAGTLTIDPAELTAVAQVVVQNRRNADPFFGGGHDVYDVPRKLYSSKVNITVKELPAGAPASFNGAVGQFSLETTLPPDRFAANSAATYTVKISGTGNLTFVQAPKLTLPTSFEQYNVKTTESLRTTAAGTSGYRQFEYPFIARAEGEYPVEAVEFTYFNPVNMRYVTLSSRPMTLDITPDVTGGGGGSPVVQRNGVSKEEVKMLGQDIRFIKLGGAQLHPLRVPFLFSGSYYVLLIAILAIFTALYIGLRKRIRDAHNAVLVRGRRANKVAEQRFRAAKRYMTEQNRHAFYEEMLRALWGYMSDKFNIPVANLTKENVREELHKRGVAAEESRRFTEIISLCDEAQYSPLASAQMGDVYAQGVDLVSRIESVIKR